MTAFLDGIAYEQRAGAAPGVVFLGGFHSDMRGTKAAHLDAWAARAGRAFLRFDYSGHGESHGDFADGTISQWRDDALRTIDALTDGPQVLVGSSMGGWLAILAALMRPERVAGMVLIAPAPDFTEDLMWAVMPESVRAEIMAKGQWTRPSQYEAPYPITRALIEDGRSNRVLDRRLDFCFPVRVLQGMKDVDVPWQHAMRLVDAIDGNDVQMTLVKAGDHRLSSPGDLALLTRMLDALVADIS